MVKSIAIKALGPSLRAWDHRAATSANRYLTNSTATAAMIREIYGIDAEVLSPPPAISNSGPRLAFDNVEPGFLLCVSRLLPYKNVDIVIEAVRLTPNLRLVIVGDGPYLARLKQLANHQVTFLGKVNDDQLRWLYDNCDALVAASYEDYGLTPLEAASFGKPAVVLRGGGFLDTVLEDETGIFFDRVDPILLSKALNRVASSNFAKTSLIAHAARRDEKHFSARLSEIVHEELQLGKRS